MSKSIAVLVPIADGSEELEAITIVDILRRASATVTLASITDSLTITASRAVKITADALLTDCLATTYDAIILPGGLPGADNLADCTPLIDMLRVQKAQNRLYAAICASPASVFAKHSLIDDRRATCYPSLLAKLPNPADNPTVTDRNCITSQGPATAIQFALAIVKHLYSPEKVASLATSLLAKP